MYSGRGFREWEIGDIDIIKHDDVYHLFHLVLPNHDFIAHAVSKDCINWSRVKNALFVGDPGEWDDDMLWTMNVCHADGGGFEMFYTGLSQKEHGYYQRIGRATSPDLYDWQKQPHPPFPIESAGPHYESPNDNARQWVSFRDPFHCRDGNNRFLLFCARTPNGVISRRGCVGVVRLDGKSCQLESPVFFPRVYDDIECPAIVEMSGRYYLIGSIREDVGVHYWHADSFRGEYRSFADNILMPQGNYAARVSRDGDRVLLYSFFVAGKDVATANRYFCPPKELFADDSGRLVLRSMRAWQNKIAERKQLGEFPVARGLLGNPTCTVLQSADSLRVATRSGYEFAVLQNPFADFVWRGELIVHEMGKFGLIFNSNRNGDGYFVSFDPLSNRASIRAWAYRHDNIHQDYLFENLQTHPIPRDCEKRIRFELLRYGHYIELSIEGIVCLSLVDGKFGGDFIGIFCDSADVELCNLDLLRLADADEDELSQHFDGGAGEWPTPKE